MHCTLADCISSAAAILNQGGRLAISIIHSRADEADQLLQANGLQLRQKLTVKDNPESEPWLMLLEAQKADNITEITKNSLTVFDQSRHYTYEMQQLCSAWLQK